MELKLPENPGVYIFKDKRERPLYVGKAINIKKRVGDHFSLKGADYREKNLVAETSLVEAIPVDSEIEALILEANLIKKLRPPYNTQLKDDKDYLYIKITTDQYPKVLSVRKRGLRDAKVYFGPFPSASKVRETLRTLRKIFPFSTCNPPPATPDFASRTRSGWAGRAANQKRACLHYHLGLCPGVCIGKVSVNDYRKNISSIILFLKGKKTKLVADLQKEVSSFSKNLRFEEAAVIQKKIESLLYITKPTREVWKYLQEDIGVLRDKELENLAIELGLSIKPERIECFDISNIGGKEAVGSMVVFIKGEADKDKYRRFKIKTVRGSNDPAMLAEVVSRRFNNDWPKPDLIIVDGGPSQLGAVLKVLSKQNLTIPAVGLAKRFEELYLPDRKTPLRLSRQSEALKLVQRIRDEAHRFAISYHRKLRKIVAFD